jgi:hypothetical protein
MHPVAQVSGVPFGNTGDPVGCPSQSQRGRKATDNRDDLPSSLGGFKASSFSRTTFIISL